MRDVVERHGALWLLVLFSLLVASSRTVAFETAVTVATFEGLAIMLIYLVLYILSPVKWLAELEDEINSKSFERNHPRLLATIAIVASVVLAVHFLVAVVVWGVYFTRYAPMP